MWIATNKSFLSIVEDVYSNDTFVVRARIKGDLEEFFGDTQIRVIETSNSDYRFRVFVHKDIVKKQMLEVINNIDYINFKDSVEDEERKYWYTKIWAVMYNYQTSLYGMQEWWLNYRDEKL